MWECSLGPFRLLFLAIQLFPFQLSNLIGRFTISIQPYNIKFSVGSATDHYTDLPQQTPLPQHSNPHPQIGPPPRRITHPPISSLPQERSCAAAYTTPNPRGSTPDTPLLRDRYPRLYPGRSARRLLRFNLAETSQGGHRRAYREGKKDKGHRRTGPGLVR
jgi:hypothetical protein